MKWLTGIFLLCFAAFASGQATLGGTASLGGTTSLGVAVPPATPPSFISESHTNSDSADTTVTTPGSLAIQAGDYLVALVGSNLASQASTTLTCGSNTLTTGYQTQFANGSYSVALYVYKATNTGTTTCTGTFASSSYRVIGVGVWRNVPSSGVTLQTNCTSFCTSLQASDTIRTMGTDNVVTTHAKALLIGAGFEWDGAGTYNTTTNSYTIRMSPGGVAGSTPFMADQYVTSTGTYPNGNFASTTSAAQQYSAFFVALSWD